MNDYKRLMLQLEPSDEAVSSILSFPTQNRKVKHYAVRKVLVCALITILILAFSSITAFAANELYGWKLLESEVEKMGGTITSVNYFKDSNGKLRKNMEYEYDTIYYHMHGRAYEKDGFIEVFEDGEVKEEYQWIFEDENTDSDETPDSLTPDESVSDNDNSN